MNNKNEHHKEMLYIRFWGKAEEKVIYKIIFALLYGLCGAIFAVLMAVLMLRDVNFKLTLLYIGFAFTVAIILSPFQYKRFSKTYHEHIKFHKSKNTQKFIGKINK